MAVFPIGVIGSGVCDARTYALAEEVGRRLAEAGATVVCGGLGGVMEAACRGAKAAGGQTIGILPGPEPDQANPYVDIPIPTGLGEARNAIVARTARALIAVGGEYGTLSEIAFALKFGRPVVGLETWQLARGGTPVPAIVEARTPEEAVRKALELARRQR
jgi:uncharacterized protein (TIGR00725 family)